MRGFTLVELSAVVVIVGILAVLAVIGYRRYIQHAKISEAQNMISAIRIAQEDYKAERGSYYNSAAWCPAAAAGTNGNQKTMWSPTCWNGLPVHADGMMLFGYQTSGGATGFAAPPMTGFVNWGAARTDVPWYTVVARADLDNDGTAGTTLVGSSFTNQIFMADEGK